MKNVPIIDAQYPYARMYCIIDIYIMMTLRKIIN